MKPTTNPEQEDLKPRRRPSFKYYHLWIMIPEAKVQHSDKILAALEDLDDIAIDNSDGDVLVDTGGLGGDPELSETRVVINAKIKTSIDTDTTTDQIAVAVWDALNTVLPFWVYLEPVEKAITKRYDLRQYKALTAHRSAT